MSAKAIKELSERIEQLDSKVKQLYQQTYSPPTNNDLYKILNDLVDKMNGRLIHHDGGKEDSLSTLRGAILSADAVIFPTDCVSHSGALEAKKLCKKMAKPLLPLRSSSLSALLNGLAKIQSDVHSHKLAEAKS